MNFGSAKISFTLPRFFSFIHPIRFSPLKKTAVNTEESQLADDLDDLKLRLDTARNRFEFLTDSDLIDSCVYEIQSLDTQYRRLLRKAKAEKLTRQPY